MKYDYLDQGYTEQYLLTKQRKKEKLVWSSTNVHISVEIFTVKILKASMFTNMVHIFSTHPTNRFGITSTSSQSSTITSTHR